MTIHQGDCRDVLPTLPAESVQMCLSSPPYWGLRSYIADGHPDKPKELGLEATPDEYVANLVAVFREVRRVLRPEGTLWLNLGDCYATGGGAVGRCPGGGDQGARFLRQGHINTQPNRMPIPGLKPKDLCMIPARVAMALQSGGWWLRSAVVWAKPNPMPESVRDRPTSSYEMVYLLAKAESYYYDADAIAEPLSTDPRENYPARARITGRGEQGFADARGSDRDKSGGFPPKRSGNKERRLADGSEGDRLADHLGRSVPWEGTTRNARNVWTIGTKPLKDAHFATFPPELVRRCILAGTRPGDVVLDPFAGAGTTGYVAKEHGRRFVGIELNESYIKIAERRMAQNVLDLGIA